MVDTKPKSRKIAINKTLNCFKRRNSKVGTKNVTKEIFMIGDTIVGCTKNVGFKE